MENLFKQFKSLFTNKEQKEKELALQAEEEKEKAKLAQKEREKMKIEQLIASIGDLEKVDWKKAYDVTKEICKLGNVAVPFLIKEMNNNLLSLEHRKLIVATLGDIGDKTAIEPLAKFFCGGTEDVKMKARYLKMTNLSNDDELIGLGIEIMNAWKKMNHSISDIVNILQRYSALGNENIESGNYKKALEYFNKFIEMSPFHPAGYVGRGVSKHYAGDNRGACGDWLFASNELGSKEASDLLSRFCR